MLMYMLYSMNTKKQVRFKPKLKSVKYRCPTPYPNKKTKCTTRYLRQKEKKRAFTFF
jgi:hypothetical protein